MSLLSNGYELEGFRSLMDPDGSWWAFGTDELIPKAMNWFVDLGFDFLKLIWGGLDFLIKNFSDETIIEDYIGQIFNTAKKLYESLNGTLGVMLFVVCVVVIFYKWAFSRGAGTMLMHLLGVLFISTMFFTRGDSVMKDINSFSKSAENVMVSSVALPTYDDEGVVGANPAETKRNVLFNQMIMQPFMMVNFQKNNVDKDTLNKYLVAKGEGTKKRIEEINSAVEEDSKDNRSFSADSLGGKFTSIFVGIINGVLMGTVTFVITIINMMLKFCILGLFVLSPLIAILSLVPMFSHAIMKLFGTILQLFAFGTFASAGMMIMFYFYSLIDSMVIGIGGDTSLAILVFVATLIKIIFTVLIWKNKGKLVNIVSGGAVNAGNMVRNLSDIKDIGRDALQTSLNGMDKVGTPVLAGAEKVSTKAVETADEYLGTFDLNSHSDVDTKTEVETPDTDKQTEATPDVVDSENDVEMSEVETSDGIDISEDDVEMPETETVDVLDEDSETVSPVADELIDTEDENLALHEMAAKENLDESIKTEVEEFENSGGMVVENFEEVQHENHANVVEFSDYQPNVQMNDFSDEYVSNLERQLPSESIPDEDYSEFEKQLNEIRGGSSYA